MLTSSAVDVDIVDNFSEVVQNGTDGTVRHERCMYFQQGRSISAIVIISIRLVTLLLHLCLTIDYSITIVSLKMKFWSKNNNQSIVFEIKKKSIINRITLLLERDISQS